MIERITREVLARIRNVTRESEVLSSRDRISGAGIGNNSLIILMGGGVEISELSREIDAITRKNPVSLIILSEWAARDIGQPRLEGISGGIGVIAERDLGGLSSLRSTLDNIECIFIPDMDIPSGSRIANFAPVTPAERLISEAIIAGKKVISTGSLFSSCSEASTPVCARGMISDLERKLVALGVAMVAPEKGLSDDAAVSKALDKCPRGVQECEGCGLCVNLSSEAVMNIIRAGADRVGASIGIKEPDPSIARLIDHTVLKPDATEDDIRKLCREAKEYNFATVCVNPSNVYLAAEELKDSPVKVTTVVGFPLGATTPTAKAMETRDAIANGADEIDMVINVGALKSGNDDLLRRDIGAVVDAARGKAIVKVILENALLTDEEKVRGCLLSKMAGADFVKTSTGFGPGGATVEDVALMRKTVGPDMGIKAAGGIRDTETAKAMVAAGATRIGASASVAITKGN